MADIDRIELLMRLSQNMRGDNEEWRREVHREGVERAKRLMEIVGMFEREYAEIDRERAKLQQYMPRQDPRLEDPMPKSVTKGPQP